MNLFELQENLKNFSQDQLVREMRNPSGSAPQYLILSELQRRRRIMNEEQAQMPQQASVAEEAVAAAGMPQGGLAQMAQAMAPQTDMVQNTARMAEGGMTRFPTFDDAGTDEFDEYLIIENIMRDAIPADEALPGGMSDELRDELARRRAIYTDRKAEGGEVRRMDVGGLADITPNLKAYGVDAFLTDPRVREAALRSEMTPYEYLQMLNEDQLNYLRDTPIEDSYARLRDEAAFEAAEFDAGRYDGPGGAYSVTERSGVPGRARLSEAGLTGVEPVPTVSAEDISRMANADRIDESADAFSVIGAGVAGPYTEFLERMAETPLFPERRGMQFGETPIGAIQSERTEEPMEETLRRILENSEAAIARDTATVPAFADRRAPDFVTAMPPEAARTMLPQPDLADDLRAARTADYNARTLAADAQRMGTTLPREPVDRTPMTIEEAAAGEFAGLPESMTSPYYDQTTPRVPGIGLGDIAESVGRGVFGDPAIDAIIESQRVAADREAAAEAAIRPEDRGFGRDMETTAPETGLTFGPDLTAPEDDVIRTALSFGDLEAQREGTSAPATGGGAAAPSGSSSDDLFEQDKWLALAQFGLGLMSSQAPTFGQAIGEAGLTGIAALRQAQEDRQDRIEAAQTRADRLAAAAARASSDEAEYPYRQIDDIIGLADAYQNQANAIVDSLGGVPTESDPEYEDYINSLARANTYRDYARQAIGIQ